MFLRDFLSGSGRLWGWICGSGAKRPQPRRTLESMQARCYECGISDEEPELGSPYQYRGRGHMDGGLAR